MVLKVNSTSSFITTNSLGFNLRYSRINAFNPLSSKTKTLPQTITNVRNMSRLLHCQGECTATPQASLPHKHRRIPRKRYVSLCLVQLQVTAVHAIIKSTEHVGPVVKNHHTASTTHSLVTSRSPDTKESADECVCTSESMM